MASPHSASKRLAFLDWTRGFAACIMLQGHVSNSFTHKDLRNDSFYVFSQFFGGLTPAVFLFLTGVTLGFLMDSQSRNEPSGSRRMLTTLLRARYLLLIGLLFHFQMWATAFGQSEWINIFKVDILNCMAAAVALLTPLALLDTPGRIRYGALAGLAIACGSPFVTQMDLGWLPTLLRNYIVPSHDFFSLFPWGAFVAFGLCCGSILRLVKDEDLPRAMPWAGLLGLVLIYASRFASDLPFSLYPKSDFWLDSPLLILIKVGVILLIACWACADTLPEPGPLEFRAPVGCHIAAGLLGPHRVGVRALAGGLERDPDGAADSAAGHLRDRVHGAALGGENRLEGVPGSARAGEAMVALRTAAASGAGLGRLTAPLLAFAVEALQLLPDIVLVRSPLRRPAAVDVHLGLREGPVAERADRFEFGRIQQNRLAPGAFGERHAQVP